MPAGQPLRLITALVHVHAVVPLCTELALDSCKQRCLSSNCQHIGCHCVCIACSAAAMHLSRALQELGAVCCTLHEQLLNQPAGCCRS